MKKFTYFWEEDSPFAQWYPSKFEIDNVKFNCAEQYMMYSKALLFGDKESANKILEAHTPKEQKVIGREVRGFDESTWVRERERIVYEGNYAKFTQNPELYKALLETKGTTLVEASPYDTVWGVGLLESDPRILDEKNWRGKNLLGKVLTSLREDLIGN